ncbi:hypothetical protein [Actinomadura logoneensis]|nr:hypothetical protein [Actinomadura logoneensis]
MSDNEALLRRIEGDQDLVDLLTYPCDFDLRQRDPVEAVFLESGMSLTPIAGDGAGGTYFLCGGVDGPVLYTDSEGGAALIAADLTEAVTLIAALPYWRDLDYGGTVEDAEESWTEDDPDFAEYRAELLARLGITPPPSDVLVARLRAALKRTAPDYQPKVRHDDAHGVYEATYTVRFENL